MSTSSNSQDDQKPTTSNQLKKQEFKTTKFIDLPASKGQGNIKTQQKCKVKKKTKARDSHIAENDDKIQSEVERQQQTHTMYLYFLD